LSRPSPARSLLQNFGQVARFCAVGLTCYLASLAVFSGLCELAHVPYLISFVITFFVGNLLGFWLNGRFTYTVKRSFDQGSLVRYMIVCATTLALGTLSMHWLVETVGLWYVTANVIVGVVNAPASYVLHRTVSYRVSAG